MPAYVSHTVMAKSVYDKLKKNNVSLDYMLTYSLGGDLSKYAKCRRDSHSKNQDKFIYNMASYIKKNNLIYDEEILGVLYGHICHYVMDDVMHPLIRKVDKMCSTNKNNHTLIEGYIDSYLVNKKYGTTIDKYDNKKIFKGKMKKKIRKMIDYVYYQTYSTKHVSWYYIFNIWLYKKIRYVYLLFSINRLKKISGFDRFIAINKNVDIFNEDKKIRYKDYLGHDCYDDVIALYDKSVLRAWKYIIKINEYLECGN